MDNPMAMDAKENAGPTGNLIASHPLEGKIMGFESEMMQVASVLENLDSKKVCLADTEEQSDNSVARELAVLKLRFSKLKKAFKEQQRQQRFLDRVISEEPVVDFEIDPKEIKEEEIQVAKQRKELKQLKADTDILVNALKTKSTLLREALDSFNTTNKSVKGDVEALKEKVKNLKELKLTQQETAASIGLETGLSSGALEAKLEEQLANIQALNERKQTLQDELLQLQREASQLEPMADQAKAKLAEKEAKQEEQKKSFQQLAHLEKAESWYATITRLIQALTGVEVLEFGASSVTVKFPQSGHRATMNFLTKDRSLAIGNVQLEPQDIDIQDIVDVAQADNNMNFLIRELRDRVTMKLRSG